MKILYLPLKAKWYEMIERGEKPEEYRVKSAYWIVRLLEWRSISCNLTVVRGRVITDIVRKRVTTGEARMIVDGSIDRTDRRLVPKHYDAVCFSYGYTKRRMLWECRDITAGIGRPEWGAPGDETFIIKLGKRL